MNHWLIAPILLPLAGGVLLLLTAGRGLVCQRTLSVLATAVLLPLAGMLLFYASGGDCQVYRLGGWPAPYGIVLVLDRLSALMLVLTALVGLFSLLYAIGDADAQGPHFHALFQFELLGLNGAFLTGDLFNLFVFFEILLIASYGLLLHGGGPGRVRAGLHYVVLNLVGSALFLFALGILYGVTGTLNMADLAVKSAAAPPADAALLQAGGLLLLVVFGLKAAILPLYFWLPEAYSNAGGAVAGLFAIMTKVGVYGILRVFTLIFGPAAGVASVAVPWLLPAALATLAAGMLGVLASRDLARMLAYFVVASVGTLLTAVALFSEAGLRAALVYLIHSTLVTAGLFLLADLIRVQRGSLSYQSEAAVAQPLLLGVLFLTGAVAVAGAPPLSGFMGKLMILQAVQENAAAAWVWSIVLVTSLLGLVALTRAGGALFWRTAGGVRLGIPARPSAVLPVVALIACSPLLVVWGSSVVQFAHVTAHQLAQPAGYLESVLGDAYPHPIHPQTEGCKDEK